MKNKHTLPITCYCIIYMGESFFYIIRIGLKNLECHKSAWDDCRIFNPIRGGGLKATPPPPTISKTIVSIFTIAYMCTLPGVSCMFQLEFFKNSRFYSGFNIKSSGNSCKNNMFVILFKIDFKYTKRRRIFMRI